MPSSVPLLALPLRQLLFIIRCVTARKMTNLVPRRRHVNPVSDTPSPGYDWDGLALLRCAPARDDFHPLLAAHASARMLFTSTTISIWLPGVVALANGPRASQGGRMSRDDRRIRRVAVLALTAGSIVWHTHAVAAGKHEETIVLIRHGEKPAGGLGQLNCQGLVQTLAVQSPETTCGFRRGGSSRMVSRCSRLNRMGVPDIDPAVSARTATFECVRRLDSCGHLGLPRAVRKGNNAGQPDRDGGRGEQHSG